MIWSSNRGGKYQLNRKRADGAGAEQVIRESTNSMSADDVSPDGRLLVYREEDPVTNNDVWVLPLDGAGAPRAMLRTAADEPRARFSPDGRLIGYSSNESGEFEAYLQPFPSMDSKWQVSQSGGLVTPRWTRDGKELFFGTSSVWSRRVLGTNPLRMAEPVRLFTQPLNPRGSFFEVSPDGERFLFAVEPLQPTALKYHVAVDWAVRP